MLYKTITVLLLIGITTGDIYDECCRIGNELYKEKRLCLKSTDKTKQFSRHTQTATELEFCTSIMYRCCTEKLYEYSCSAGLKAAEDGTNCALVTDKSPVDYIGKECCECCKLGLMTNKLLNSCDPPATFAGRCAESFVRCCNDSTVSNSALRAAESINVRPADRCEAAKCEHFCIDDGGEEVECSCHVGYQLSSDGFSCVDIDECFLSIDNCLEGQLCINTPGSYKCIRTLSCGTGYALSSDSAQCIGDVDECSLGTDNCGPLYICRNTNGSYRCDPRTCPKGQKMNLRTGQCSTVNCPSGYRPTRKGCVDINECETPNRCLQYEECINIPGGYKCQERENLCTIGHRMDRHTGICIDIDECAERRHTCLKDNDCINLNGTYRCRCLTGFVFNETTMKCEDIDECQVYNGHVCSSQATCENTYGSFRCRCISGYKLAADQRNCEDIDECKLGIAKCTQRCVNIPGSYLCVCNRGFRLSDDGFTCEDIDECALWAGIDGLCMGNCTNTLGSFKCECPIGYRLHSDGRTCSDIDECGRGECQGNDTLCVNTLGSYKCHRIQCPKNYVYDKNKKKCFRDRTACFGLTDDACKNLPLYISWKYIAIPRLIPLSDHRTSITLFTVKGPTNPVTTTQFELKLKHSKPENFGVVPATRNNFLLQKGETINSAVIAIRDSLDGPQEIELQLLLRLSVNDDFHGMFTVNLIVYVGAYKRQIPFVF